MMKISRSIVENTVMKYFLVINGEASENQLEYCTEAFKQRAATMAKDNLSTVTPKHYDDIHIHKSQVASYHRDHDAATAKFQVSLEYKLNGIKAQHIYQADYSSFNGDRGQKRQPYMSVLRSACGHSRLSFSFSAVLRYSSVERTWKVSRISMLR